MTDSDMRIAIAEAEGWKWSAAGHWVDPQGFYRPSGSMTCGSSEINFQGGGLPDYLNDLNAMHEAELQVILSPSANLGRKYRERLGVICDPNCHEEIYGVHATARQRAEAFLKCIGRWKDQP